MRKVLHLMGALTDQDVEWLVSHGQTRFVPSGTMLIRQGEATEGLFIVLEGKLSVRKDGLAEREVAPLYPGETLGEISFVDSRPPSASVVAVQDSHVFVLSKSGLTAKLTRDTGFAARFYRALAVFLADRLRQTTANLGYGRWNEDAVDADGIPDDAFDDISMAAKRFDDMLRQLRVN